VQWPLNSSVRCIASSIVANGTFERQISQIWHFSKALDGENFQVWWQFFFYFCSLFFEFGPDFFPAWQ